LHLIIRNPKRDPGLPLNVLAKRGNRFINQIITITMI